MKENLLIIGAGGLGRMVSEHASLKYTCAFVDDGIAVGSRICNIPVIANTANLKELLPKYKSLVIAIGNNEIREHLFDQADSLGFLLPNIICDSAYISPFSQIGRGCILLNNAVLQNGSTINDGVILNPGVEIHHDSCIGAFSLIYSNSVIRTNVSIGKKVKIGSNVTVSNNSVVDENSIIKDGSII